MCCALSSDKKTGIEVNFLTGRYVATYHNNRERAEWPPHTARLFSALVSVWAEEGQDGVERDALEWLESQRPPDITASAAVYRSKVSYFVPVNDTTILGRSPMTEERAAKAVRNVGTTPLKTALALFPEGREKQERFYPSVTPRVPRVTYVWDQAPQDDMAKVLDGLLSRVTRLGHSSSLVSCRIVVDPLAPNYTLSEYGNVNIRSVRRGQLAALLSQYVRHQGYKRRALPFEITVYKKTDEQSTSGAKPNMSGMWLVFKLGPGFWPSTLAVSMAAAMRAAILNRIKKPIPEEISGLDSNCMPTKNPHVAFVILPFAGFAHADGGIRGVAVSLPRTLSDTSRHMIFHAIADWEDACNTGRAPSGSARRMSLNIGDRAVDVFRNVDPSPLKTLQTSTWSSPSRRWISVTPISLPRHPGNTKRGSAAARARAWREAESAVMLSCEHAGLPCPEEVVVSYDPFTKGAFPVARYPPFIQKGASGDAVRRELMHASLVFGESVNGPMTLGTGRFSGLGLMKPVPDGGLA